MSLGTLYAMNVLSKSVVKNIGTVSNRTLLEIFHKRNRPAPVPISIRAFDELKLHGLYVTERGPGEGRCA